MATDNQPVLPVYARLRRSRNLAADDALVVGLPDMEPGCRPQALDILLERHSERALARLVAGLHRYDDDLRALLIGHADRLHAGTRVCIQNDRFEIRRSAISLISQSGDFKQAYLLADTLTNRCRQTAKLAAEALLAMAGNTQDGPSRPTSLKDTAQRSAVTYVASALRRALAAWPAHQRKEIVAAAASWSEYLEDAILSEVGRTRTKAARAFNSLLGAKPEPRLAGFVLRALRSPELRAAAVQLLATCRDRCFWEALLEESWLVSDQELGRSCVRVRSLGCLEGDINELLGVSARRAAQCVRLISRCGLGHSAKADVLGRLIFHGSDAASRAAVWAVVEDDFDGSEALLQAVAARHDMPLSQVARLELRRRGLGREEPSTDDLDREAAAGSTPAPATEYRNAFEPYWVEYDSLEPEDRIAIGHVVVDATPDFVELLGEKLAGNRSADRIRALLIVGQQGFASTFEQEVYMAAQDAEATLRSLAMTLLASLDTAASRRILRAALDDPDPRVQANAVEALSQLDVEDKKARLRPKLDSANNRVRANAIKALLGMRVREAAEGLVKMLASDAGAERLSALWVVERMKLTTVMDRLVAIAHGDPDPRVRSRARQVLDRRTEASSPDQSWGPWAQAREVPA